MAHSRRNSSSSRRPASILEWFASPTAPRRRNSRHVPQHHQSRDREGQADTAGAASRPPTRTSERVRVEFKALDDRYLDLTLGVKDGCLASNIEPHIRHYYRGRNWPLAETAFFQLYDPKGRQLAPDDRLTNETPTIWYRVSRSQDSSDDWRLSHWQDRSDAPLHDSLARAMVEAINSGATVGQLRQRVAEYMGIQDANRVVLVARDGLRRGSLQGNCWEVRQVQTWLCRWLCIDVNPENLYVVIHGLRREYVYHPNARIHKAVSGRALLEYLDSRIFRAVRQHGKSKLRVSGLSLSLNGSPIGRSMPVKWGATYNFELSEDDADAFSREESWLLPQSETCSACIEDKKVTEMPTRITQHCKHEATMCRDCLKQWLQAGITDGTWDRLKCPDCSELLGHQDVKRNASKETFDRYDTWMLRAALKEIEST